LELPEKLIFAPGVTIARERVPAISAPVSNQRPGISVIEKLTSFEPATLLPTGSANDIRSVTVDTSRLLFRKVLRIFIIPPQYKKFQLNATLNFWILF
jgi:hypothetical protein